MGYRRDKAIRLVFPEEGEFAGLEIEARSISTAGMMGLLDIIELLDRDNLTAAEVKTLDRLFRLLAGCPARPIGDCPDHGEACPLPRLKGWNLEDEDGAPVPLTYESFMSEDFAFCQAVAGAWLEGVLGTPDDLGKDSNSGGPPGVESIPMETLSAVPLS